MNSIMNGHDVIKNKMATDGMLKDVGAICSRLINHRAALQSEIQHFVKEFETRRGDNDIQTLHNALRTTNNMNTIHMPAIQENIPLLEKSLREVVEATTACQIIISEGEAQLKKTLSQDDVDSLASDLQYYKDKIDGQRRDFDTQHQEDKEQLMSKLGSLEEQKRKLLGKVDVPP